MVELKKRSDCKLYVEDAKWGDGFFGAEWNRIEDSSEKLMLIKYYKTDRLVTSTDKSLYGWHDKNLVFFHIGKFTMFEKAMKEVEKVYRFDSMEELAKWMES